MTDIEQIKKMIDEKIKPMLQADGGSIEFVDFKDGVVQVRLKGACSGCPGAAMTLGFTVERMLKNAIPAVQRVQAV